MTNEFWNHLMQGLTLMTVLLACQILSASRSLAAEVITVRYGLFTQSVPIADLRQYAETGNPTVALQDFLRYMKRENQTALRGALHVAACKHKRSGSQTRQFLAHIKALVRIW